MAFVTAIPLSGTPTRTPATTQRFTIRAAKHVQFKGAKKSERTRPRKHRPSDINRKPPPFNPEPLRAEGLPPVQEVFKPDEADAAFAGMTTLIDAAMVEQYEKSLAAEAAEPEPVVAEPKSEPDPVVAEASSEPEETTESSPPSE